MRRKLLIPETELAQGAGDVGPSLHANTSVVLKIAERD